MKKIFALLLAVLLCVAVFVACGEDTTTTEDPANTTTTYTPAWQDNTTLDNELEF